MGSTVFAQPPFQNPMVHMDLVLTPPKNTYLNFKVFEFRALSQVFTFSSNENVYFNFSQS